MHENQYTLLHCALVLVSISVWYWCWVLVSLEVHTVGYWVAYLILTLFIAVVIH